MEVFSEWLAIEFFHNTGRQWLAAAGIALLALVVFFVVTMVVAVVLKGPLGVEL